MIEDKNSITIHQMKFN